MTNRGKTLKVLCPKDKNKKNLIRYRGTTPSAIAPRLVNNFWHSKKNN